MERRRRRVRQVMRWWPLVAAALVSLSAAAAATRAPRPAPVALHRIVVSGDTLWGLASECRAPRRDRSELTWLLQELNDLRTATLRPGQALLLPLGERSVRDALRDPDGFAQRAVVASEVELAEALAEVR